MQNLVSMNLTNDQVVAVDAALDALETNLSGLVALTASQRRSVPRMGGKSEAFCRQAFGRMLHHTPAEALPSAAHARASAQREGLRRAWYWACRDESIDPKTPTRLPLLFALDSKLRIANGFAYQPDCGDIQRAGAARQADGSAVYCGTSFADDSFSGDAESMGGVDTSDGGGNGGGD